MYNEVIELVSVTSDESVDEYGDPIQTETKRTVFCDVRSIGMKEFYQAQTVDFKPEIKFVLADYYEYQEEPFIEYNGFRYKVLRTYRNGNEIEITCYGGVRA